MEVIKSLVQKIGRVPFFGLHNLCHTLFVSVSILNKSLENGELFEDTVCRVFKHYDDIIRLLHGT